MVSKRRNLKLLVLVIIMILIGTACVRPLATDGETTEVAEVAATPEADQDEVVEESTESEEEAAAAEDEEPTEEVATTVAEDEAAEAESPRPEEETPEAEEPTPADTSEPEESPTATSEPEAEATATDEGMVESTPSDQVDEGEPTATEEGTPEVGPTEEAMAEEAATEEAAVEDAEETDAELESTETQQTTPSGQIIHVVAPGENLYRIGLKYGMSWVPIASANGITDPDRIVVGQELIIPGTPQQPVPTPTPKPPDTPSYTNYVVQPGDTLSSISRKFGVSAQEIAEANGLVNPNRIYAGQVLKIPTSTPESPPQLTHTVKSGETLYSISLQYGVQWLSIAQANKISPPYVIYAGQTIVIPGG